MDSKNQKNLLVFKIIAFESKSTNSLNLKKDISHCPSMSQCVTKHPQDLTYHEGRYFSSQVL